MNKIPSGTVTFLFTDIEGSMKLAQKFQDTISDALMKHHSILNKEVDANTGFVFKITGDAFYCAFENPIDALNASVEIQKKLIDEKWHEAVIKVRMGIHSGLAEWTGADYEGYITLAGTQRLMSAAYGGQILISNSVFNSLSENALSEISFRDLGERRLKDLIQPMRIYQVLYPGLQSDFPPLKTLDVRPNNLPAQLTNFIGRETEIKNIKKSLANTKLLTLLGTGGTGKTRLSLQVGADVIDDFVNGVWFIELDSLFDPGLLPQRIAQKLGLTEKPKQEPEDSVSDYLKDKEILIILDNCEHIIDACTKFSQKLLMNSPGLKILATSREVLSISGEQTHQVLPLSHPDPEKKNTPEQLKQYESVRLFIERALSVNPDFKITTENAQALSQICFQLDGIPLAIELAAARIKSLTLQKINERLKDRFKLLVSGTRTALPRQQTLRALVDWSYDLLTKDEKILLNRLSVFSGGWTLEAAEIICWDDILNKENIFDLLTALVEKSLIIFESVTERYRMLETIRQYSLEKLESSDEMRDVELNHLKYFMELAENLETKLNSSDQTKWLEKMEMDLSNFNEALKFSLDNANNEYGLRLSGSLGNFWIIHGHLTLGRLWYSRILNTNEKFISPSRSKVLNFAAKLARIQGEIDHAKVLLEECLILMTEQDDQSGIALTLKDLGSLELFKGELEKTQNLYEKSLDIYRKLGDERGISSCINNLGNIFNVKGDVNKSLSLYEESLSLKRKIGDKRAVSNTLVNIGVILSQKTDYKQAKPVFEESLTICREQGNKSLIIACLINLSNIARIEEEYSLAKQYAAESLQLSRELGEKQRIAQSLLHLGQLSDLENDNESTKEFFEQSLKINREIGSKHDIAVCMNCLGNFHKKFEHYEPAKKYFEESLEIFREVGNKEGITIELLNLGFIANRMKDYKLSETFYSECLTILQNRDDKDILTQGLFNLIEEIRKETQPSRKLSGIFASIENSVQIIRLQNAMIPIRTE